MAVRYLNGHVLVKSQKGERERPSNSPPAAPIRATLIPVLQHSSVGSVRCSYHVLELIANG